MRKVFILSLISILLICFVACSEEPDYVSRIFEVDTSEYASDSEDTGVNHVNMISSKPIRTQEKNIDITKKLTACNKTYDLNYKETIFYPDRTKTIHSYAAKNYSESSFLIEEGLFKALFAFSSP